MTGGQPSSMAIIELTPFSGYNAAKPSLDAILSKNEIKRFDADGSPVILYFDEVVLFLLQFARLDNIFIRKSNRKTNLAKFENLPETVHGYPSVCERGA